MANTRKTVPEFVAQYEVLNPAQQKAVNAVEGPVMVIAGPGTGKTTILTLRIANIIRTTDTAPESILALTFTESGAFAMRRKLVGIIGPAAYRVNIHTFHGFAEHIIQQYPDYFPRIIGSSIITDAEQIKIIEKSIKSPKISILRPYGDPSYYVKSVLNEIHILKHENVSPKQLLKSINDAFAGQTAVSAPASRRPFPRLERSETKGKLAERKGRAIISEPELCAGELEKLEKRDAKNRELAFIYSDYEAELEKNKYYDFDDMLLELIRAMESDNTFKLILQETYQYILADEHQDANASQNRILELLADFHESPNLFIVGDDKQAIYRFQGASLENFLYFKHKYPVAEVIDLEHNYRSHQGILDASHSLILNNPGIPGRERHKLLSLQVGGKPIFVDKFPTIDEELGYMSVLIAELIKKGEKPEEIAILYRENKEAAKISEMLRAFGISHRIESENNILGEPDVAAIIMLCKAIYDPSNDEDLGQALLLPELGCDSAEVMEVFNEARKEKRPLYEMLGGRGSNVADNVKRKNVRISYNRILKWSGEAQTLAFPNFLQKLIQETGLMKSIVSVNDSLARLGALESFYDRIMRAAESKKTFYLKDFIEYIGIVSEHGLNAKRTWSDHIEGVRLMTAHRAKGLEFNHVFIMNAVDGTWGNRIKRTHFSIPIIEHARDTGRIEDERRLFYVAMTRARESVNISYADRNGDRETTGSQFISEIDPKLVVFETPRITDKNKLFIKKMTHGGGTENESDNQRGIENKSKKGGANLTQSDPKMIGSRAKSITILNPHFIRSKFLGQAFSVTHLNNFLKCPWEYFFVNLIRLPQAPSKHQMYGIAIHSALRAYFDAYRDGRQFTKKQMIELFKFYLDKQPMSFEEREESYKKGKVALEGYYDEYHSVWSSRVITEYNVKGVDIEIEHETARLELNGKLDRLELLNDHDVTVIDYKTAKPKSRNEIEGKVKSREGSGGGDYKRQLVFYKLLLDSTDKFNMKYGEIDFIEPNERGFYKKERFEISEKETANLRTLISKVAGEIINLSFLDSSCKQKDCAYCRLGKILNRA